MANIDQIKDWKQTVYPVLASKVEEFHLIGYETATIEEVWECLIAKLERKKEKYKLHQLVAEIFNLSVNEYMNWLTISAYTEPNSLESNILLGSEEEK